MNYPERIELVLTYKYDPDDSEFYTERVDALRIGEYYKLLHIPAYAPNLAYGDIVKVEFDEGEFHFDGLIEESGYSVSHIVIWKPEAKEGLVKTLDGFGCRVNTHVSDNYLVVSIPPNLPYQPVRAFLLQQENALNIDFREYLSKIHAAMI